MKNRKRKQSVALPVQPVMCGTCPFRDGGKAISLRPEGFSKIVAYVVQGTPHVCHHPQLYGNGGEDRACRGARDVQLQIMHAQGSIAEPTDDALDAARIAQELEPLPRAVQNKATKTTRQETNL